LRHEQMLATRYWRKISRFEQYLVVLFLFTLPLVNPWIRGDGVGYYAYVRSVLIQGNLGFENDWRAANKTFAADRVDEVGRLRPERYTSTGYLDNHFSVGPSILWAPFLVAAHVGVRAYDGLGGHVPADGFSRPYIYAMGFATALYGFLGLWISFRLTQKYIEEQWAFLATLGIWFASSLPVYMYFNPSWSHAHSAFTVALFLWYWDRTRGRRTVGQWILLGAIAGLMMDVYYPNAVLLLAPLVESTVAYERSLRGPRQPRTELGRLFLGNLIFAITAVFAFVPTLITRWIIYGSLFSTGYESVGPWHWTSPLLWTVLFSSDHGLFSWTPILIFAVAGLFVLLWRDGELGGILLAVTLAFYFLIASYPDWDGVSSFGNRFFVSLTPIFVLGLAETFDAFQKIWKGRREALMRVAGVTALLILWNLGFIFQWGTHLISERGPISWEEMVYNQFRVVPGQLFGTVKQYMTNRREMMSHIGDEDAKQVELGNPDSKQAQR
jgi:hypothetical protein